MAPVDLETVYNKKVLRAKKFPVVLYQKMYMVLSVVISCGKEKHPTTHI